jgi:hypothetical protein
VTNGFPNLVCGFDADMGRSLERIRNQRADAALTAVDDVGPEPVSGDSVTMTVSRRERDSILLKRRVMNSLKGRPSRHGDASP